VTLALGVMLGVTEGVAGLDVVVDELRVVLAVTLPDELAVAVSDEEYETDMDGLAEYDADTLDVAVLDAEEPGDAVPVGVPASDGVVEGVPEPLPDGEPVKVPVPDGVAPELRLLDDDGVYDGEPVPLPLGVGVPLSLPLPVPDGVWVKVGVRDGDRVYEPLSLLLVDGVAESVMDGVGDALTVPDTDPDPVEVTDQDVDSDADGEVDAVADVDSVAAGETVADDETDAAIDGDDEPLIDVVAVYDEVTLAEGVSLLDAVTDAVPDAEAAIVDDADAARTKGASQRTMQEHCASLKQHATRVWRHAPVSGGVADTEPVCDADIDMDGVMVPDDDTEPADTRGYRWAAAAAGMRARGDLRQTHRTRCLMATWCSMP